MALLDMADDDPNDPSASVLLSGESSESSDRGQVQTTIATRRKKLNEFLIVSGRNDVLVRQARKSWESMSSRTQKAHVSDASGAIIAVLDVITPGDAGSLWRAVQESRKVDEVLGVTPYADEKYVSALAETYQNATGWDTKRQVLSILADLLPLSEIRRHIPGLTEYRWKTARRHRIEYGRGVPVLMSPAPRIRIDEKKLDHFLTFITSPHVVQDLPFGQRYVKLSNGGILETPNVIRTLITSRICAQYQQYCTETNVQPFSEATMRRVLSACPATERKSLQGLDYYHAEGAKAFDDLVELVSSLELSRGHDWVASCQRRLKEGKQYIKTDFKVGVWQLQSID